MSAAAPGAAGPLLAEVVAALGPASVVTDLDLLDGHAVDWTGRFRGRPPAVLRPDDTAAVEVIVGAARRHGVALVPQGGNTGLVGGATPCDG